MPLYPHDRSQQLKQQRDIDSKQVDTFQVPRRIERGYQQRDAEETGCFRHGAIGIDRLGRAEQAVEERQQRGWLNNRRRRWYGRWRRRWCGRRRTLRDRQRGGGGGGGAEGVAKNSPILIAIHGGRDIAQRQRGTGGSSEIGERSTPIRAHLPLNRGHGRAAGCRGESRRLACCHRLIAWVADNDRGGRIAEIGVHIWNDRIAVGVGSNIHAGDEIGGEGVVDDHAAVAADHGCVGAVVAAVRAGTIGAGQRRRACLQVAHEDLLVSAGIGTVVGQVGGVAFKSDDLAIVADAGISDTPVGTTVIRVVVDTDADQSNGRRSRLPVRGAIDLPSVRLDAGQLSVVVESHRAAVAANDWRGNLGERIGGYHGRNALLYVFRDDAGGGVGQAAEQIVGRGVIGDVATVVAYSRRKDIRIHSEYTRRLGAGQADGFTGHVVGENVLGISLVGGEVGNAGDKIAGRGVENDCAAIGADFRG